MHLGIHTFIRSHIHLSPIHPLATHICFHTFALSAIHPFTHCQFKSRDFPTRLPCGQEKIVLVISDFFLGINARVRRKTNNFALQTLARLNAADRINNLQCDRGFWWNIRLENKKKWESSKVLHMPSAKNPPPHIHIHVHIHPHTHTHTHQSPTHYSIAHVKFLASV
jgi:hypothetical protein